MKKDPNSVSNSRPVDDPFVALYPNIAFWVKGGWIEIGQHDYSRSFVRALDEGGLVWEGEARYSTAFMRRSKRLMAASQHGERSKDCEGEAETAKRDTIAPGTSFL